MRSSRSPLLALGGVVAIAVAIGCRKAPMMTKKGCEDTLGQADAAMQTLDVSYNRPQTCTDDKDCIEIARPSCISFCSGMAFAARDAPVIHQRVAESEARECKAWSEADCAAISPRPIASCASYRPHCQDTKCTMVYP